MRKLVVTGLSNGATFVYDGNGNMTQRVELVGSQRFTYTQGWDVENRLIAITNTASGQVTTYAYNASGQRVNVVGMSGHTMSNFMNASSLISWKNGWLQDRRAWSGWKRRSRPEPPFVCLAALGG
ncbi:MAG: hypothetical protein M1546_21120 [Chloroflexi bacterium]|nr:hypothetical protein [Chloroflexota bacterium]